jgi:hypothetical protein
MTYSQIDSIDVLRDRLRERMCIYSLSGSLQERVESCVFSTRLTCITRQLDRRAVETALEQVDRQVQDWSGGTRIGESLHNFNYNWSCRVLNLLDQARPVRRQAPGRNA